MVLHENINEIDNIFESYYVKFWIGIIMFCLFIIPSLYYVLSLSYSFSKFKNKFKTIPTMELVDSSNEFFYLYA